MSHQSTTLLFIVTKIFILVSQPRSQRQNILYRTISIGRNLYLPKHFYALTNHCLDIIKQSSSPVHVDIVVVVVIVVVIVVVVIVIVVVVDVVVDVKNYVEDNEEEVHQTEN